MTIKQFGILSAVVVLFGFLGGAASAGFLGAVPARAQNDVITTSGFNIYDTSGNLRMMLTTNSEDNSPMIIFVDANGKTRAVYGMSDKGEPVVSMTDSGEVLRTVLAVTDSEGPAFEMYDASGEKTILKVP